MEVLAVAVCILVVVCVYLWARINDLERQTKWWLTSMEERKADKGTREVFEGDEWKDGVIDDEQ